MSTSASIAPPTIRIRINHDKTQKGWRCNETTVEVTGSANDYASMSADLADILAHAHADGLAEANRRNALEGFAP
jgi:hypothetical protein